MASQPDNEIDPDVFLHIEKPGTPPQLHASTPLDNGPSQPEDASDDDKRSVKEPVVAKPSSDMTKSLFDYELAKSEEGFDGASMNVQPMSERILEHKGVQCDPPKEDAED